MGVCSCPVHGFSGKIPRELKVYSSRKRDTQSICKLCWNSCFSAGGRLQQDIKISGFFFFFSHVPQILICLSILHQPSHYNCRFDSVVSGHLGEKASSENVTTYAVPKLYHSKVPPGWWGSEGRQVSRGAKPLLSHSLHYEEVIKQGPGVPCL